MKIDINLRIEDNKELLFSVETFFEKDKISKLKTYYNPIDNIYDKISNYYKDKNLNCYSKQELSDFISCLYDLCNAFFKYDTLFTAEFVDLFNKQITFDNNVNKLFIKVMNNMSDYIYIDYPELKNKYDRSINYIKFILDKYYYLIDINIILSELVFLINNNKDISIGKASYYHRLFNIPFLDLVNNKEKFIEYMNDISFSNSVDYEELFYDYIINIYKTGLPVIINYNNINEKFIEKISDITGIYTGNIIRLEQYNEKEIISKINSIMYLSSPNKFF